MKTQCFDPIRPIRNSNPIRASLSNEARRMDLREPVPGDPDAQGRPARGVPCPECGAPTIPAGGADPAPACGWEACGW